jgi:hypothetical protein
MQKLSAQASRSVVMIRPHHFGPNAATVEDNVFQATDIVPRPPKLNCL